MQRQLPRIEESRWKNYIMARMEKIKITQVKSPINRTKKQKLTLLALGLRKIGMTVEHDRTPNILGMVKKVSHLITVEN